MPIALSLPPNIILWRLIAHAQGKNLRDIFICLHLFRLIHPRNALQLMDNVFYHHRAHSKNSNKYQFQHFFHRLKQRNNQIWKGKYARTERVIKQRQRDREWSNYGQSSRNARMLFYGTIFAMECSPPLPPGGRGTTQLQQSTIKLMGEREGREMLLRQRRPTTNRERQFHLLLRERERELEIERERCCCHSKS